MAVNQSLTLTLVSQSVEDNSSKVRILWQSAQTGGSYNMTTRTAYYYVSVNGGGEEEKSLSYVLPYQSTVTLADTTVTVPHDASGNGKVAVRTWMNTNISAGTVELNKSLTLPQIPRASTVSAADGIIGKTARIAISKKSSAFTHSIAYKFGSLSGFVTKDGEVSTKESVFGADSVDFLLPESFYSAIPGSSSGVCSLTVRTYSGSSQIGQAQTASFTVRTDEAVCAPVVTGSVHDGNATAVSLTGDKNVLIRYHSDAVCTITATAQKGATIVEKRIGGAIVTGSSRTISGAETGEILFYAKDSRGYESRVTVLTDMVPYIRLTNNASVTRDDPTSGNATLVLQGQVFDGSFGQVENTLEAFYQINGGEAIAVTPVGSYYAAVPLTGMDYESTYTITVTVKDRLETVQKTLTLQKGLPVFDWGETDFAFHVPVAMDTPLAIASGGTGKGSFAKGMVISDGARLDALATASGALYATAAGGTPSFGTLPIAQGGTGATTADAARTALGAAPAGLTGSQLWVDTWEQLETQLQTVYKAMADYTSRYVVGIVNGVVHDLRIWKVNANYGTVQMDGYGAEVRRRKIIYGGVWLEWEYLSPPMYLGVEYRTTARWQGKPVYTKLVDFGALPNATTKTLAHGCAATRILRAEGQASNGQAFPICGSGFYNISLRAGLTNIDIHTDYNYSAYTATVQLWYTKN